MAEGNPADLEALHDPGREGTEVRRPRRRPRRWRGAAGWERWQPPLVQIMQLAVKTAHLL
jgi:hypothetical protein